MKGGIYRQGTEAPERVEMWGRVWLTDARFVDVIPCADGGWKIMEGAGNTYVRDIGKIEA